MSDHNVIDIYEWHRPRRPAEFMGGALAELPTPPETKTNERPRKMKLSELTLAVTFAVLVSLLIASYV